jgi:hypothetical protein
VFALDLKSAYEGEHRLFGFLSLANLAQNDAELEKFKNTVFSFHFKVLWS